MMRRTQLYLNEPEYQFLKNLARSRNVTMAMVIRNIIDSYMTTVEEKDSLFQVIGIANVKEDNIASNYEEILYGKE